MTDYFPLISRAVATLEKNSGEARRAVYERARTALVTQLRGLDPPLPEAEITRHRLALEEAIRKVEAESIRRAREVEPRKPAEAAAPLKAAAQALEPLGGATREASRAARGVMNAVEGHQPPPAGRVEPLLDRREPSPSAPPPPRPAAPEARVPPPERTAPAFVPPPPMPEPRADVRALRSPRRFVLAFVILGVLGTLALGTWWQRDAVLGLIAGGSGPAETAQPARPAPATPADPSSPKVADRIPQEGPARPSVTGQPGTTAVAPTALVAQRAVLFEEDPAQPQQGRRFNGAVVWRTETISGGQGQPADIAVRADIEIPERRMAVTVSVRRNADRALPASHTIELMFTLPPDMPQGGIGNVPGLLLKAQEQVRGAPLAGLAVKVTNTFFLIGLSAAEGDIERNIQLLKERPWIDIPIVYGNGRRAIIAIEKGTPGERAFLDAFRAWGQ